MSTVHRKPHVVYLGLAVADTVLAAAGADRPRWLTKPLLMPALMVAHDRPTRVALALSGAGDVALLGRSQAAFTAGLGCFLGGQVAWIAALRARGSRGGLRRRPVLGVPVVAAWAGLNAYLWKRTGRDRIPVVLYSTVLAGMALVAVDTGDPATAAGGGLFMASDSLIALQRFGGLAPHEGWVMATYTAAQALLAAGGPVSATGSRR
jgi:uncharacterized membrane protein YhhN